MTPEQEAYHEKCLNEYKSGGTNHSVWVIRNTFGMGSYNLGPVDPPLVGMGNDDDSFYSQYFHNWDEVNTFVNELKKTAFEAWGENK